MTEPLRHAFIDARGVRWEVRESEVQHGDSICLRFESPGELREFCPVPDDWHALPDAVLDRLCRRATKVAHG